MTAMLLGVPISTWIFLAILLAVFYSLMSIRRVGAAEVGLVLKRVSLRKLAEDNPIAFHGEPGYQADLLMPGLRWKPWLFYEVEKFPWVQVPAGEVGVVISQVGAPLPISTEFRSRAGKVGRLTPEAFGLRPEQLDLLRIEPQPCDKDGALRDMVGIVTTFEGDPLPSGDIASRLGGFADIDKMEKANATDGEIIEVLLGNKNSLHNNYQDFQAFLDNGGRIGLQHDPLLYSAYALNPFLVSVE